MSMAKPIRRDAPSAEITVDSVDAKALRLLETDPSEYFRQTHKRLPFGFASEKNGSKSD